MKLTLPRWVAVLSAVLMLSHAWPAQAVRIKDIATFSGVRDNQLIGYGLVVGPVLLFCQGGGLLQGFGGQGGRWNGGK